MTIVCAFSIPASSIRVASRVNFIVVGSLAASMNTNIGYDQRSYFQWVQLLLATKDGRQLNTFLSANRDKSWARGSRRRGADRAGWH